MLDKVSSGIERIGYDNNKYLIAMWNALLNGWKPNPQYSKEQYIHFKSLNGDDYEIGWVGFNCSYSGKFFGGYAGITDTKEGVRDYQKEAIKNIENQLCFLENVTLSCRSFDDIEIPHNAVIYCDPPYKDTTKYNSSFDNEKFWEWVILKSKYAFFYISEYNAPDDFIPIFQKQQTSSLSANGRFGKNKNSIEKLFIPKSQKDMINEQS